MNKELKHILIKDKLDSINSLSWVYSDLVEKLGLDTLDSKEGAVHNTLDNIVKDCDLLKAIIDE